MEVEAFINNSSIIAVNKQFFLLQQLTAGSTITKIRV